jgi:hypothetical protein
MTTSRIWALRTVAALAAMISAALIGSTAAGAAPPPVSCAPGAGWVYCLHDPAAVTPVASVGLPSRAAISCSTGGQFSLATLEPRAEVIRCLPGNYPRNKCVDVSDKGHPVDVYDNATGSVWVGYHTHNCQTGHIIKFYPGWDGGMLGTFGRAWADGRLHGVMRIAKDR